MGRFYQSLPFFHPNAESFLLTTAALVVYFLPVIIYAVRRHRVGCLITVLDVFFTWTGIGWIIALVLALVS